MQERKAIQNDIDLFRGNRPDLPVANKTVLLVDDGIATGASMLAAVDSVQQRGARKIIATTPVCAPEAFNQVKEKVLVCELCTDD